MTAEEIERVSESSVSAWPSPPPVPLLEYWAEVDAAPRKTAAARNQAFRAAFNQAGAWFLLWRASHRRFCSPGHPYRPDCPLHE